MSDFNFASVQEKPKKRKRKKWPYAIIAIGVLLVAVAAIEIVPMFVDPAHVAEFADSVKVDTDGDGTDDIDWDGAQDENEYITGWITIDNTIIDYPVLQGDDNDYYLHHDMFGNWSYSGIFADCRCDVDGNCILVYGHHMDNGTMFENVSHTHHQDAFNTIGTLHWETPSGTKTDYEPAFAMSVYATYATVQEFDHNPTTEQLNKAAAKIAKENNITVPNDTLDIVLLPSTLQTEARNLAEKYALREWLRGFYADASSKASNVEYLIEHADKVLTTTTCTSSLDNNRTLTVFVHTSND